MRLVAVGIVCAFLGLNASANAETVSLTIAQGALAGTQEDGILVFKDIPFAAAPVGPLRWRAPQPGPSWQGVRAADRFGDICPQPRVSWAPALPQNEDCLSLNVWTPDAQAKLPVMVWIYGGAFITGSSALPTYTGVDLAKHGVVVVSFNYRLGWLGFFNHPALAADAPNEAHGNYGLMDQIAALEWVKKNIASFGGDPDNVTIFGESAGGMSVNDLMASPRAKGLFNKAISESGLGLTSSPTAQASAEAATSFGARHDAPGDGELGLARLRALSVVDILADQAKLPSATIVSPMIDGQILTEEPGVAFARGEMAHVPYIAGSNSNESTLMAGIHMTPDSMLRAAGSALPTVRKVYEEDGPLTDDELGRQIFGDALFASGAQALSDFVVKSGEPAYVYQFAYVADALRGSVSGVGHGGELAYVFGLRGINPALASKATPADRAVIAQMQAYWTNFAKTGDPNGEGLPHWPTTSGAEPKTLFIGDDGTKAVDGFRKNQIMLSYAAWMKRTGQTPPN
ncbi:MAG TPA: carboxylesterase family protein [Rhizomicrobium sp.]|nr:carboxylesterase family protein [Rhizomicrobium sp.]